MRLFEGSRYPSLVPVTLTELQEIINAGHFDKLIGEFEGQYLDVKGQPYQFADGTDARRELAKDVAAFANSAGGFVLIGLATKTSDVVPSEQISTIRALSTNLFRPDQYRKVLAEWLYPQPKNLSLTFVQHANDAQRGFVR